MKQVYRIFARKKDASVRYYTSLNAKISFFFLSFLPKKTTTELFEILWEVHVGVSKLRCFQAETRAEIASPSAHNGLFFVLVEYNLSSES